MTGRAAGYCAGYDRPGYANPVYGGGFGFGHGWGRGFRGGYGRGFWRGVGYYPAVPAYYGTPTSWTAPTREQELDILKQQALNLEQSLEDIRKRIGELESNS
jgi:hypothetical protein